MIETAGTDLARSTRHRRHWCETLASKKPSTKPSHKQHDGRCEIQYLAQRFQFVFNRLERLTGKDEVRRAGWRYRNSAHRNSVVLILAAGIDNRVEGNICLRYRRAIGQLNLKLFFAGCVARSCPLSSKIIIAC